MPSLVSLRRTSAAAILAGVTILGAQAALAQSIDNSTLNATTFREHKRTFGLVFTLPKEVNETLNATVTGPLKEKLINAGLGTEAQMYNIPHVTVVHVHNADPATPERMLKALPKLPAPPSITLKQFYTTEAAKGAGAPRAW